MHRRLALSMLLSTPSEHKYNIAMYLYDPPAVFQDDLKLPPKPYNAKTETNDETLRRLSHDLTGIINKELSVIDRYRMFRHTGGDWPS